jgi:hypothetical protein
MKSAVENISKAIAGCDIPGSAIEIELRWKSSRDAVPDLNNPKVQRTVSLIKSRGRGVSDIYMKDLDTKVETRYTKERLHSVNASGARLVASRETVRHVNVDPPSLIRFKYRVSSVVGKLRVDVTIAMERPGTELPHIRALRDKFLCGKTGSCPYSAAPWDVADSVEVEIEALDDIDPDELDALYRKIRPNIGYEEVVRDVASALGVRGPATLKSITTQVTDLNRSMLSKVLPLLDSGGWMVTDKADGKRGLLWTKDGTLTTLTDVVQKAPVKLESENVIDAEVVGGTPYAFDILVCDGKWVGKAPLIKRLEMLGTVCDVLGVKRKTFVEIPRDIDERKSVLSKFRSRKLPYETDGVILTPPGGAKERPYKLKKRELLSIDFLAVEVPERTRKLEPYCRCKHPHILYVASNRELRRRLGLLFLPSFRDTFGAEPVDFGPIQFAPSTNPMAYVWDAPKSYDRQIVELTVPIKHEPTAVPVPWKLLRVRDDRKRDADNGVFFGNYFSVAESVWSSFDAPIELAHLWQPQDQYFVSVNNTLYRDMRYYNSGVKRHMMEQVLSKSDKFEAKENDPYDRGIRRSRGRSQRVQLAIDLGSGNGQDLWRYSELGVCKVLFTDVDAVALQTLLQRKHDRKDPPRLEIVALRTNLNQPSFAVDAIRSVFPTPVPAVVCNMALHYMLSSYSDFAKMIGNLLEKNGRFLATYMDGEAVAALPQPHVVSEGGRVKYEIRHKFKTYGTHCQIEILLPFSDGKLRAEPLVNQVELDRVMKSAGLRKEYDSSFDKILAGYSKLRPVDADYVRLYKAVVYRKIK